MAADPVLDSVRCPGCLSVCDVQSGEDDGESWQIAACSGCGYEMDPAGVITVRQMLDGAETGSTWTDVDLPAWTRMIAQALRGVAAGPQATPDQPTPPSAELERQRGYSAGWHAGRREAIAQATPGQDDAQ